MCKANVTQDAQVKKRFDIQFLRGLAVSAVVIFHAFRELLGKGFLGVDIFFVISGFLITGIILRQLESGSFTFKAFFMRRARRLLPASLSTLIITSAFAFFVLTPIDYSGFIKQLIGSLTFTANIVLPQQTGYFAGEAETKPLLHVWSLSLEEQFYLIIPVLLWLCPLGARPWLLMSATVLSGLLCFVLMSGLPILHLTAKFTQKMAFFMLPARAWELLIGSIVAWLMLRYPQIKIPHSIKYLLLIAIFLSCIIGVSPDHPGADAVIVTLATGLLLAGHDGWLHSNLISRSIATLGNWSYSVYLVHWPLFSFAFIIWLGEPPVSIMIMLVIASILLGYVQFHLVEQAFQRGIRSYRVFSAFVTVAVIILGILSGLLQYQSQAERNMSPVIGFSSICDQHGGLYIPHKECQIGSQPTTLLWGDSYAMHLLPGLVSDLGNEYPLAQATKSACAPIIGMAHVHGTYTSVWANECVGFNQSVLSALADNPNIQDVIIASSWVQVFNRSEQDLLVDGQMQAWEPVASKRLLETVLAVQAMGKRVILVGPMPMASHDVGACNLRVFYHRPVLRMGNCAPSWDEVETKVGEIIRDLQNVSRVTGATVIFPTDALCPQGNCQADDGGQSLYRDVGHLTHTGSELVIRRLGIAAILTRH